MLTAGVFLLIVGYATAFLTGFWLNLCGVSQKIAAAGARPQGDPKAVFRETNTYAIYTVLLCTAGVVLIVWSTR